MLSLNHSTDLELPPCLSGLRIRKSQSLHVFQVSLFPFSLPRPLATYPPIRPDSLTYFGAIQIIYLLTYLLAYLLV